MDRKIVEIPYDNRGEFPWRKPCRMCCREEEMLAMNQIDQVKELQRQGYGPREIAARGGIDRKTAAKIMLEDYYSPSTVERKQAPSKLDPWKPQIDR